MTPLILDAQLVSYFRFYFLDALQDGMRHGQEMYGLVEEFGRHHRLTAYQFAFDLAEQNLPTVITVSKNSYKVWVLLHSSTYLQAKTYQRDTVFSLKVA